MSPEAALSKHDISVRHSALGDYDSLKTLFEDNWPREPLQRFELKVNRDPNEVIFIAENARQMVASVFYTPRKDHAYFSNLVVKKDHRRQGIAAEMLRVAEDQAIQDGFNRVAIIAINPQLAEYYSRLGFRRVSDSGTEEDKSLLEHYLSLNFRFAPDSEEVLMVKGIGKAKPQPA